MNDHAVIVGVDEAGRGALAGPVVAGACILTSAVPLHPLLRDSKQLTPGQREEVLEWIRQHCVNGIGIVEAEEIDRTGILAATEKAMQIAVQEIATQKTPSYLLIDGRDTFWFDYPHSSIIRGDASEPCIAAGSIIAKVTRDRMMESFDSTHPHYNFGVHKGYGTKDHFSAISKYGSTALHRMTFLKKFYAEADALPQRHQRNTPILKSGSV